jgi:uncharacterized protein YacL (UPF0231 family)
MPGIELGGTLNVLRWERAKIQTDLAKLNKAITVLEELSGTSRATSNGNGHKRTLSVAARNKIAKAQKLRWAKVRAAKAKD